MNTLRKLLFSKRPFRSILALLVTTGCALPVARADATNGTPASGSKPAAANSQASSGDLPANAGSTNAGAVIEAQVRGVLDNVCHELSSARTLTHRAEITFDSVLPSGVNVQYAAAMDTASVRTNLNPRESAALNVAFSYRR